MGFSDISPEDRHAEWKLFWRTVLGLVPGRHVGVIADEHPYPDESFDGLSEKSADLVLDEARRVQARDLEVLESTRARAQFTLTTGLAIFVVVVPQATSVFSDVSDFWSWVRVGVSLTGLLSALLGMLAAAAVFTAKKTVSVVEPVEVLELHPVTRAGVARLYVQGMHITRNTKNAAVTVFRHAVLLVLVGYLAWALAEMFHNGPDGSSSSHSYPHTALAITPSPSATTISEPTTLSALATCGPATL